jgi:hypothetical protein
MNDSPLTGAEQTWVEDLVEIVRRAEVERGVQGWTEATGLVIREFRRLYSDRHDMVGAFTGRLFSLSPCEEPQPPAGVSGFDISLAIGEATQRLRSAPPTK